MLKLIKAILTLPIMFRCGYYLEFKYYDKLISVCKKRLHKNDKDFIALFYLMYCYIYQKSYELSTNYFIKMLEIENVSFKTQKYYIYHVIGVKLTRKEYNDVIRYCEKILSITKDDNAKKLLMRSLCESYYYRTRYHKLNDLCKRMKNEYTDDNEIISFADAYIKILTEKHLLQ